MREGGSLVVSPIFGGMSAQAEFEILCGVGAHAEFSAVEFLAMTGAETYCLPRMLDRLGYTVQASQSFKPNYFNATNAYRSIGFRNNAFFPKKYAPRRKTYLTISDTEEYMFDGLLFRQNLDFLRGKPKDQPVFNHIVGVYGHYPHNLEGLPPLFPSLPGSDDEQLLGLVNQFHHRSKAVAEFVRNLQREDPRSLVIITSDHLPPLSGPSSYEKLGYLGNRANAQKINLLLVIQDGQVVPLPLIRHQDLAGVVLDFVSDGAYCRENRCPHQDDSQRENPHDDYDAYAEILAHAAR